MAEITFLATCQEDFDRMKLILLKNYVGIEPNTYKNIKENDLVVIPKENNEKINVKLNYFYLKDDLIRNKVWDQLNHNEKQIFIFIYNPSDPDCFDFTMKKDQINRYLKEGSRSFLTGKIFKDFTSGIISLMSEKRKAELDDELRNFQTNRFYRITNDLNILPFLQDLIEEKMTKIA